MRWLLFISALIASPLCAAEWDVPVRAGAITETLGRAAPGDTLRLRPGTYSESVVLDFPVVLEGDGQATIDGGGRGSVITVTGANVAELPVHSTVAVVLTGLPLDVRSRPETASESDEVAVTGAVGAPETWTDRRAKSGARPGLAFR